MAAMAFDHVWLARTIEMSISRYNDSLEELAFHISRDVDWVEIQKTDAIARLQNSAHDRIQNESALVLQPIKESVSNIPVEEIVLSKPETEICILPDVVPELALPQDCSTGRTDKSRTSEDESEQPLQSASHHSSKGSSQPLEISNACLQETLKVVSKTLDRELELREQEKMIPLKILGNKVSDASAETTDAARYDTAASDEHLMTRILNNERPEQGKDSRQMVLEAKTDYFEPINLDSPKKSDHPRNDSAYFSAPESPAQASTSHSSPRRSVAFASLPPRQPFAKKSMGPRSSQSRASMFDGNKSVTKTPSSVTSIDAVIKCEPQATPEVYTMLLTDKINQKEAPRTLPEAVMLQTKDSLLIQRTELIVQSQQEISLALPIERPMHSETAPKEATNPFLETEPVIIQEKFKLNNSEQEDEWLPRIDFTASSPKKSADGETMTETVGTTAPPSKAPAQSMLPTTPGRPIIKTDQNTPGPLKAAMQAASAKATSYLRQARTAFGSPSIQHTKVFRSTTPISSPPKPRFKTEPQTPKIYPDLSTTQINTKPTQIPSKSPRKSPLKTQASIDLDHPRRSPRRSPKKGTLAMQSMAVIAARNASAKGVPLSEGDKDAKASEERPAHESPQRPASKINAKYNLQSKAKPLNIRVATASQREIDQAKERKAQPGLAISNSTNSTSVLSRSTNENGQVEYLSKSQQLGKKPIVSRQIKALAAATQAKERAEKEQVRREQQRKDMERKRHENAKRQADEEEKRKAEAEDALKKRKAPTESRPVSIVVKKQAVSRQGSNASYRDPLVKDHESMASTAQRQSMKRPLIEIDETTEVKRQRTSEQTESRTQGNTGASTISKPVRVSLQKKSMYGHPGEATYKKSTAAPAKPSCVADEQNCTGLTSHAHLPPSESIELPEIHSDYSDSDDDGALPAKDGFERPNWAETPELRKLLRRQQRVDPDDVFGPIPPLQMEEIFKGKERALARFRPRSSSANWSANDKLSVEEVTDYARAMGYKN